MMLSALLANALSLNKHMVAEKEAHSRSYSGGPRRNVRSMQPPYHDVHDTCSVEDPPGNSVGLFLARTRRALHHITHHTPAGYKNAHSAVHRAPLP